MKYNDGRGKPSREENSSNLATKPKPLMLHHPYLKTPRAPRQKKRKYPKNFHRPHQVIKAKEAEHTEDGVAEPGEEAKITAADTYQETQL